MYHKFAATVAGHAGKDQITDRAAVTPAERMMAWKRRAAKAYAIGDHAEAIRCLGEWYEWAKTFTGV